MSELKAAAGHVVTKVDMDFKNSHTFQDGTKIILERDRENFDRKYVAISQGEVVDSSYIPKGATIYFHHNATHAMYEILNYRTISGNEVASNIKYFSIPEDQCYLWREGDGPVQPLKNFVTALRVFKPYTGILQGIEPTKLKDTLYITSGALKGQVVRTLKACDYEIIFQGLNGREETIIRCRHSEDENFDREEIVAIDHAATKKVNEAKLLVGLIISDAGPVIHLEQAYVESKTFKRNIKCKHIK